MSDKIKSEMQNIENMLKHAKILAANQNKQPACKTCKTDMWLGFFFDGTGNNRDQHFPLKKHSNVVSLQLAHQNNFSNIRSLYYEGIGTPFRFKDYYEEDESGYDEADSDLNQAFGLKGSRRLEKSIFDMIASIEKGRSATNISEINVSVYGFSRGAALARIFVNWLAYAPKVQQRGNTLAYDGIPLRVRFLGIFDTVESFTKSGANWVEEFKTVIPKYVENSTHIVAGIEMRQAFPVTHSGVKVGMPQTPAQKHVQIVYPGCHSDIGGGYLPVEAGKSNAFCRIPMLAMHEAARAAGVTPILSIQAMKSDSRAWQSRHRHSFEISAEVKQDFQNYMASCGKAKAGTLRAHIDLHHGWFLQYVKSGAYEKWLNQKLAEKCSAEDKRRYLAALQIMGRSPELTRLAKDSIVIAPLTRKLEKTLFGEPPIIPEPPASIKKFIERYVHDSFLDFLLSGNLQLSLNVADYAEARHINSPKA